MRATVFGEKGRRYKERRRRLATRRLTRNATSLRIDLDQIAAWPNDTKDEDFLYTSSINYHAPRSSCPCGYGRSGEVHARYCLDCDRGGLDDPMRWERPSTRNDYPGLPVDYAPDPTYVGDDRPSYRPPAAGKPARLSRKVRRSAARAVA